ncbi:hypothetical protein DA469_03720 [Bacillus subtilis]|nr:hypothetical protein DA469_03720 [Bacillus subtilis]
MIVHWQINQKNVYFLVTVSSNQVHPTCQKSKENTVKKRASKSEREGQTAFHMYELSLGGEAVKTEMAAACKNRT